MSRHSIHTERGHLRVLGERNHFKDLPCTCQVPEGIVVDASRVNQDVPQFEEEWHLKWNPNIEEATGRYKRVAHKLAVKPEGCSKEAEISEMKKVFPSDQMVGVVKKSTVKEIRREGFDDKVYNESVVKTKMALS